MHDDENKAVEEAASALNRLALNSAPPGAKEATPVSTPESDAPTEASFHSSDHLINADGSSKITHLYRGVKITYLEEGKTEPVVVELDAINIEEFEDSHSQLHHRIISIEEDKVFITPTHIGRQVRLSRDSQSQDGISKKNKGRPYLINKSEKVDKILMLVQQDPQQITLFETVSHNKKEPIPTLNGQPIITSCMNPEARDNTIDQHRSLITAALQYTLANPSEWSLEHNTKLPFKVRVGGHLTSNARIQLQRQMNQINGHINESNAKSDTPPSAQHLYVTIGDSKGLSAAETHTDTMSLGDRAKDIRKRGRSEEGYSSEEDAAPVKRTKATDQHNACAPLSFFTVFKHHSHPVLKKIAAVIEHHQAQQDPNWHYESAPPTNLINQLTQLCKSLSGDYNGKIKLVNQFKYDKKGKQWSLFSAEQPEDITPAHLKSPGTPNRLNALSIFIPAELLEWGLKQTSKPARASQRPF